MPRKTTEESKIGFENGASAANPDTLDRDQDQRRYYYDDAHGYETFDPESKSDDEEDEEDDESGEAA